VSRPAVRLALAPPDLGLLRAELARFKTAPGRPGGMGTAPRPSRPTARVDADGAVRRKPSPYPQPVTDEPQIVDDTSDASDTGDPTIPDATVAELVARSQAGDGEAFGLLYDRYVDTVYRYIYYRVGGATLAEDLVSETFLRALRRIDSFTWQGRDFAAWLVTIARNLIADHFKSGRYRLEITTEDILETGPQQTTDGPEDLVLDAITNETLLSAIKKLNPEQQECIVLRFLQGMSVNETALAMGKNDGAIKALQYRAVRALARLLPEDSVR
jgi:RNA polymerase sigma-70 factor, ECF subfamily